MSATKLRRPRSERFNGKMHQETLSQAAAAIVQPAQYATLPDSARKAQRLVWQKQLQTETGCTEKSARKYIASVLES